MQGPKVLRTTASKACLNKMENENQLTLQQVKEKLLKLSEKGLISKTSFQIKKMNEQNCRIELERYEQKLLAQTAEKIKGIIFDGFSKTLSYMKVIDEADSQKLEEELKTNHYLQEEVVNISKSIAPWIPYIGLTLAGITIGKFAYTRYLRRTDNASQSKRDEVINKSENDEPVEGGVEQDTTTDK